MTKFCRKCGCETERQASGRCTLCRKAANALYRSANQGRERERTATYYAANPDLYRKANAAWRAANSERKKASRASWAKANPQAICIIKQNRRARGGSGTLSRGLVEKLHKLQRGKCACCGLPLGESYHLDHIMPLALGGPNVDSNTQLLRSRCNLKKSAQHPVDYMRTKGLLL